MTAVFPQVSERVVLAFLLMVLVVGSLQVSQCGNSDNWESAAQEQYDRMHK